MDIDLKSLKELMRALQQFDLNELEIETEGKRFRIVRGAQPEAAPASPMGSATNVHITGGAPMMHSMPPASMPAPSMAPAEASAAAAPAAAAEDDASIHYVTSPFVGTFYEKPSPDAAAFAKVGDKIKVGQTLCIVEAMKLMNEIESDVAGEIVEVLAQNGKPVEYGDKLFKVKKA